MGVILAFKDPDLADKSQSGFMQIQIRDSARNSDPGMLIYPGILAYSGILAYGGLRTFPGWPTHECLHLLRIADLLRNAYLEECGPTKEC
jgi:hypothetical protein